MPYMVRVSLKPSRRLAALLICAHLAAAAALIPLDLSPWAKIAIAAAVAGSLWHALRLHALQRNAASVTELVLHAGDRAAVRVRSGDWVEGRVLGTTYVTPALVVLNLRLDGRRFARHVVILRDSTDAEALRRMRVLLRWAYRAET